MRRILIPILGVIFSLLGSRAMAASLENTKQVKAAIKSIQVGPRPYFLVDDMDPGALKATLKQCSEVPLRKTDFSIGHRGAALQFRNIPRSPMKPPLAWALESLNAR